MLRSRQHQHVHDKGATTLEVDAKCSHTASTNNDDHDTNGICVATTPTGSLTTSKSLHHDLNHRQSSPSAIPSTTTAISPMGNIPKVGKFIEIKHSSGINSKSSKVSLFLSSLISKLFGNRRRKAGNGPQVASSSSVFGGGGGGGGRFGGGTVPLRGYLTLLSGFLAVSTSGTALDLQGTDVHPCMKVYWRLSATSLALLPLVICSLYRDGPPRLTFRQWMLFPCAAIAYSEMTTSFVTSLSLTSIANAFVFSNMTSLILLCVKAALGRPTVRLEVIGVIIGFIGALICSGDESRHSSAVGHDNESQKRLGDLLALSASFGMAVYLSIAKDLRSKCNLFVFTFALFVCCQFFILSFMMVRGEPVEFSTHKNYGVLGWVNSDMNRLPVELYMVLVCSLMGTIAYVAVLQYFDSVVVSTVMLMEPTVAALTGYLAGVDTLPGLQTWLGDTFVVIGSTMVIYCGATKDEKKQQCQNTRMDSPTKAMHESLPYLHVHDQ